MAESQRPFPWSWRGVRNASMLEVLGKLGKLPSKKSPTRHPEDAHFGVLLFGRHRHILRGGASRALFSPSIPTSFFLFRPSLCRDFINHCVRAFAGPFRPLDVAGAGVLGQRGQAIESIAPRSCREDGGSRVPTHVMARKVDISSHTRIPTGSGHHCGVLHRESFAVWWSWCHKVSMRPPHNSNAHSRAA